MKTIEFQAAMSLFSLRIKQLEGDVFLQYRTVKRGGSNASRKSIAILREKEARLQQTKELKRDFIKAFKGESDG